MASTEQNEQIVRRVVKGYNERDSTIFDELFAEDVIDHTPFGETKGRDGLREVNETLVTAFPDIEILIDDLITEGDTAALRARWRGTHDGPFMGIEPTGTQIEVKNVVFGRIDDGKIAERWVQLDMFGLMQQLGAIDPPEA